MTDLDVATLPPFPTAAQVEQLVDECDGADRPAETYTIDELAEAAGCTAKQVDHWTRAGLLHPVARERATNGVPRRWSHAERLVAERLALLVDVGLSTALAAQVARHTGPGPWRSRGVRISIAPDGAPQVATPAERELLRAPGRAAVAGALRALVDAAAAAAELLGLDAEGFDGRPLHENYDVDQLVQMGEVITGPIVTPRDNYTTEHEFPEPMTHESAVTDE
jgi:DNA-binding transcriptional MerR regulator